MKKQILKRIVIKMNVAKLVSFTKNYDVGAQTFIIIIYKKAYS